MTVPAPHPVEVDPDIALMRLRKALGMLADDIENPAVSASDLRVQAALVLAHWAALDAWLVAGGIPPWPWIENRRSPWRH